MSETKKTIEVKLERTISAAPDEVFDAWLNPKVPGTPWNMAEKFVLNPEVDGLFFWHIKGTSHYGRFTEVARPKQMQHTWVSPNTLGLESTVTVTFAEKGNSTLMTLVHSGLPDTEGGKSHDKGWNYIVDEFLKSLTSASR